MANFGISGLSSGINSSEIIDALIQADRGSTRVLENRKTVLEGRLEAVRNFNTRLLTAQVDLAELKRPATFSSLVASSSNAAAVDATASSSATAGTYTFEVLSLAKAHQTATAGVVSDTAFTGTGSISLQVGSGTPVDIAIGSGDASLQGIAKAINAAKAGVTASVVKDGTASPYRLVLQSNTVGSGGSVTVNATDGNGGDGADLAAVFSGMSTLSSATDATIRLGSGPGAITITKPSNTVDDLIPGVTLSLKQENVGPVRVTVTQDTKPAVKAVKTAVDSINAAITYLSDNTGYNSETREGGILLGESGLRLGLNRVVSALTGGDSSLTGGFSALAAVGVTIDRDTGTFKVDEAVLTSKLAQDPNAVSRLFTSTGTSSVPGISFAALGSKTATKAFDVAITTAATQAAVGTTGEITADGGGNVVITGANKSLTLSINGKPVTVTLAEGTWSRSQIAAQLQASINSAAGSGSQVAVALNGTTLDLRSVNYGSKQSITVTGGSANGVLNLSTTAATGTDVQGTIDGVAATGAGQVLAGAVGTASEGLRLLATTTTPTSGTMTVRKGVSQRVADAIGLLTDVDRGALTQREDGLESSITAIGKSIGEANIRLEQRRARYEAQFLAMERAISSFKSQENTIQGQIAAFENAASARNG